MNKKSVMNELRKRMPNLAAMGDADYTQDFSFEENVMPTVDEEGFGEPERLRKGWKWRFGAPLSTVREGGAINNWELLYELRFKHHIFQGLDVDFDINDGPVYIYTKDEATMREVIDRLNQHWS